MAQLTVVYWRDIPAQVIVKKGRESAKIQLNERFEKAIDRAAMRANLRDTDFVPRRMAPRVAGRGRATTCRPRSTRRPPSWKPTFDEAKLKSLVESGGLEAK